MLRRPLAVRDALVRGDEVSDAELDQVFPEELRDRSSLHWTPVDVARRAAQLLAPTPGLRLLDVGAGVGKVCVVGALVTEATWWGIEQDPVQVSAARQAAHALDASRRTRFVQGDGAQLAWDDFDGFYFYNPFTTLMLSAHASAFLRYATVQRTLRMVEARLAAARPGARVVTFYGFGGAMPPSYTRLAREPAAGDALELWVNDGGRSATTA